MKLPKSWSELTIAQYYKLIPIFEIYKDDFVERQIKLLCLFTGKSQKEIEFMNVIQLTNTCSGLSFLSQLPESKLQHTFSINNNSYKAALLTSDMTAGQFIDFSHIGQNCTQDELVYHMRELIACMCKIKKGRWYNSFWDYEGYDKTSDCFLELPMSIAYPYYVFFCNVLKNLQLPILDYSQNKIEKEMKK